jgi:uncharacterized protein YutE (UPF0331/DUF86 family)
MRNRDRILTKIDELQGYLRELNQVRPSSFQEYCGSIEKRRSSERLLQISIECVLDICGLIVSALSLGLPSSEEDLLEKLEGGNVFEAGTIRKVKSMRAFRNILVHRYGRVDDQAVFDALTKQLDDFNIFIGEVLCFLNKVQQ